MFAWGYLNGKCINWLGSHSCSCFEFERSANLSTLCETHGSDGLAFKLNISLVISWFQGFKHKRCRVHSSNYYAQSYHVMIKSFTPFIEVEHTI